MGFDRHTIHRWLTFCDFPHSGALEHIWEHSDSFIGSALIEILFSSVPHILPHLWICGSLDFMQMIREDSSSLSQSAHTVSQRSNRVLFAIKKASIPFPSLHVFSFLLFCSCISWLSCCWDKTPVKISLKKKEFILAYSLTAHILLWLESPGAWGSAHSQERVWEVLMGLCEQLG